jgi:pimeloyl-ACP methyl ester carboxylesterase
MPIRPSWNLLTSVVPHPYAIIAAGHAASYVLKYAVSAPLAATRLVLIAPTWRGPLPTMLDRRPPFLDQLCRLVDLPGIGPLVYRLNVNQFMMRHMAAGHVYTEPEFLTGERLRHKLDVVRAAGARFASVRFVTGRLDPLDSRDELLALGRRMRVPTLVLYGAETPPRSRAEMEALAAVSGIRSVVLARGKLSMHEEFPGTTFEAMAPFLRE